MYDAFFKIDVIKNCWVKKKILSPAQVDELRIGVRHNNRAASDETKGLLYEILDELLEILKSLGKGMAEPSQPPIDMATVSELLDIQVERVIEAPPNIS